VSNGEAVIGRVDPSRFTLIGRNRLGADVVVARRDTVQAALERKEALESSGEYRDVRILPPTRSPSGLRGSAGAITTTLLRAIPAGLRP
jgi:hypothetical protein